MTAKNDIHPRESISALLDGALAPPEQAEVEKHLRACADCRAFLQDLRVLAGAVAAEDPPPIPSGMTTRIRRAVGAELKAARPTGLRRFWLSPIPLGAAATLFTAILAGWIVMRTDWRPGPQKREPVASVREDLKKEEQEKALKEAPESEALPSDANAKSYRAPRSDVVTPGEEDAESTEAEEGRSAPAPEAAKAESPPADEPQPGRRLADARTAVTPEPGPAESVPPIPPPPSPAPKAAPPEAGSLAAEGYLDLKDEAREEDDRIAPRTSGAAAREPTAEVTRAAGDTPEFKLSRLSADASELNALGRDRSVGALRYVAPEYEAILWPDGSLRFQSKGYQCGVTAPDLKAKMTMAGDADEPEEASEISQIFSIASASRLAGKRAEDQFTPSGAPPQQMARAPRAPLTFEPGHETFPEPVAEELGRRIDRLVREHYLPLLENRCGPPPIEAP